MISGKRKPKPKQQQDCSLAEIEEEAQDAFFALPAWEYPGGGFWEPNADEKTKFLELMKRRLLHHMDRSGDFLYLWEYQSAFD